MEDKILTRHPEKGKQGVRISKAKYDQIEEAITSTMQAGGELTFNQLTETVEKKLKGKFDGSVAWYVTTVKLDLEARGVIKRVSQAGPQRLRLAGK
jgi:hypothetical protein